MSDIPLFKEMCTKIPRCEGCKREKILVSEKPEIVVHGTKEKPYFEIKYKKVGDNYYNIGYSSYYLDNCFEWLGAIFEVVEEK